MAYEFADFRVVLYNTITLLNEGNLHSHTGHTYVLTDYNIHSYNNNNNNIIILTCSRVIVMTNMTSTLNTYAFRCGQIFCSLLNRNPT